MKTMGKLIKRFNRTHKGYHAELDTIDSYNGFYTVWIDSPDDLSATYYFYSGKDFREWMDGVVLD